MKEKKEIVYLKHPVSAEEKAKQLKAGKRIIDIKFAPEEIKKPAPKKATKKTKEDPKPEG